jgi:hypothetical protein
LPLGVERLADRGVRLRGLESLAPPWFGDVLALFAFWGCSATIQVPPTMRRSLPRPVSLFHWFLHLS